MEKDTSKDDVEKVPDGKGETIAETFNRVGNPESARQQAQQRDPEADEKVEQVKIAVDGVRDQLGDVLTPPRSKPVDQGGSVFPSAFSKAYKKDPEENAEE